LRKQESSFSEEKEAKRLFIRSHPWGGGAPTGKSFLVLFFKKERAFFLR
jgi:hypothetical protein